MAETLFERYRDALRRGHVAARAGRRAAAVAAYREAAEVLPDRAVPHIGEGRVELDHGDPARALAAFEAALTVDPDAKEARSGRADALVVLERADEAAEELDRLARQLIDVGMETQALAALERALELADSPWRRTTLDELRTGATSEPARGAASTTWSIDPTVRRLAEDAETAALGGDHTASIRAARALAALGRTRAAIDACHDALSVAPGDPEAHRALGEIYRRRGWAEAATTKDALIARFEGVLDHPEELDRLATAAAADRDAATLVEVATRHARQGRVTSAMEAAMDALAIAPDDPGVHLGIAGVRLRIGWRAQAIDGVARLARLVALDDDARGRELIMTFLDTRIVADPALRR